MFLNSSELYYNQLISQNFKDENYNRANVKKVFLGEGILHQPIDPC